MWSRRLSVGDVKSAAIIVWLSGMASLFYFHHGDWPYILDHAEERGFALFLALCVVFKFSTSGEE